MVRARRQPKQRKVAVTVPRPSGAGPCVAGIGASAGGYEALRDFFAAMPPDSGIAFVVVQHLDPTHKSLAAELLGKSTNMPVVQAADGTRVEADHVYTNPPNADIWIEHGTLRLTAPAEARARRLPIDRFLRALGEDQHERAIAIILSGSGSDGTLGVETVAAHGGIVLAQDPGTAQFDSMPRGAIATGLVNHVLPVRGMPAVLVGYARHPYTRGQAPLTPVPESDGAQLRAILEEVHARCGFSFAGYRQSTLVRRIYRRMGLLRIDKLADYVALLHKTPAEIDALFKDFLIGVTDFFRDAEAWKALEAEVVRPLVASKSHGEPVRAWCAGIATGEEAYSLAMLLLEAVQAAGKRCPVQVFATDTNEDALAFARAGTYPAGIAEHLSPARLRRFFVEDSNDHRFQVGKELRDAVIFGAHNLFRDPPFSKMDLVSCRNLLIYLDPEVQKQAILLFHFALRPKGFLFLGPAETVGQYENIFVPLSRKWRIFRRSGATPRERLSLHLKPGPRSAATPGLLPRRSTLRRNDAAALAQRLILERFAPAAVLFDSGFNVLHFSGETDRYLAHPKGPPTNDLLALAREGLRSQLRSAARAARSSNTTVVVSNARVKRGKDFVPVRLSVAPVGDYRDEAQLLLAVFEDAPATAGRRARHAGDSLVRQLEEELRVTKEDLQNSIERLATANEELSISNEEAVANNEELQSLNEELESSKEELQSLNEELSAVNQELQGKLVELETANNDLSNVLASSDIAAVRLDTEHRIGWSSPAARNLLGMSEADTDRPVGELSSSLLGRSLIADADEVLAHLAPKDAELETESGGVHLRRTLPYRLAGGGIDGVLVTFTDITESRRKAEQQLAAQAAQAHTLEQRVQERTAQLRQLMFELSMAEDRERRAIALDLHDHLGQLLAIANVKLAAQPDGVVSAAVCAEVRDLVLQAERTVRSLAFQISPPVLYELGLVPALEWLADEMKSVYGLDVTMRDDGKPKPLDSAVRSIVFRVVRELLINVSKHAKVGTAAIDVRRSEGGIEVTVSDAGVGFDPAALAPPGGRGGFGLPSVRERLAAIGGEFEIDAIPSDGTVAKLRAPFTLGPQAAPMFAP